MVCNHLCIVSSIFGIGFIEEKPSGVWHILKVVSRLNYYHYIFEVLSKWVIPITSNIQIRIICHTFNNVANGNICGRIMKYMLSLIIPWFFITPVDRGYKLICDWRNDFISNNGLIRETSATPETTTWNKIVEVITSVVVYPRIVITIMSYRVEIYCIASKMRHLLFISDSVVDYHNIYSPWTWF